MSFVNKVAIKLSIFAKKIKSSSVYNNVLSKFILIIKSILYKIYSILVPSRIREDSSSKSKLLLLLLFSVYFLIVQFLVVYGAIFIVVKLGGKSFTLPNVEGIEMFTAFSILQKEGMTLQIDAHIFPEYELGTVVVQEPKPGTKVKRGRSVSLVVNMSPSAIVFMPDLTGKSYSDAMETITNELLPTVTNLTILEYATSFKKREPNNTVLSQMPFVGEAVTKNTEILLTVNKVPTGDVVSLGDLVGSDALSSIQNLESMMIAVNVENVDIEDNSMYGKVIEQSLPLGKYKLSDINGITIKVANDLDNDSQIKTFQYSVPKDRVGKNILKITLDDENGRIILFDSDVRVADSIRFSYGLKGSGVVTVFFNDTPFETINVD